MPSLKKPELSQAAHEHLLARNIMKNLIKLAALAIFTFSIAFSGAAQSETENSDWIQLAPGFEEKKIGARVDSVGEADEDGMMRVEVSFPDTTGRDVEEVIVTARRQRRSKKVEYHVDAEVIKDLQAGRTGIIFYLGQQEDFQVRLNYIDYTKNPRLAPGS